MTIIEVKSGNMNVTAREDIPADKIDTIVLHCTESKYGLGWLIHPDNKDSSAHFDIARDGTINKIWEPAKMVTWHAGNWFTNHRSIGIELENIGVIDNETGKNIMGDKIKQYNDGIYMNVSYPELYPAVQYGALADLILNLMKEFPEITFGNILRHSQIDITGYGIGVCRCDPGLHFDMDRLFGIILALQARDEITKDFNCIKKELGG